MTPGHPVVLMVLALSIVPGTGCSWILVNKPPPDPIRVTPPVACTTSVASPVVDTVLAAAFLGTGIAFIAMSNPPSAPCTSWCFGSSGLRNAGAIAGGVVAAAAIPLAFSAGFGYATTAECRELRDVQLACISGVEASCNRLMKSALDECERSSRAACESEGDASRPCQERRTRSCMEAAGWSGK